MKKERLTALDGLRGIAAFTVALFHAGLSIEPITTFPLVTFAYEALRAGPNSVQILFVLSGFLMAYLYPTIRHLPEYIQKRYTRIFPIFIVTVLFISQQEQYRKWQDQVLILFALAMTVHLMWRLINWISSRIPLNKILLYGFILLQLGLLGFNLFITPKLFDNAQFKAFEEQYQILTIISNITLTTPFSYDLTRFSAVFWSLAPELYFYLLYPFIVIPLIKLGKKYGALMGAAISILTIIALYNLDDALRGSFALYTINISRSSGFVVGVLIGTIFQLKDTTWNKIEPIFKNHFVNALILAAFVIIQWADMSIRDGQSIWFMNRYYILSSIIFGFTVIAAIIPNTIISRIFSNKILVFFGLISYSLYLIHFEVLDWSFVAANYLKPYIQNARFFSLTHFGILIGMYVAVSAFLFKLVESLYFENKRKTPSVAVAKAELEEQLPPVDKSSKYFLTYIIPRIFTPFILISILIWSYTSMLAPSLSGAHHTFSNASVSQFREVSMLEQKKIQIPFTATQNNLSVITMSLWYYRNASETVNNIKDPAVLIFRLYQPGKKKPFFESERDANMIESASNFPYGFPTIADSKGKQYIIELELKKGTKLDHIIVNTWPGRITTTYTNSKEDIIKKPYIILWNRIAYTFTHPDVIFLMVSSFLLAAGVYASKKMKKKE